jgi:hypothetical protein
MTKRITRQIDGYHRYVQFLEEKNKLSSKEQNERKELVELRIRTKKDKNQNLIVCIGNRAFFNFN